MSGTSLDGIDVAHCTFSYEDGWKFELLEAETYPYSAAWVQKLKNLVVFSPEELLQLDQEYTNYLADVIQQFIYKQGLTNLDAVCSHGHTALHQPHEGLTYQIGNLPKLAEMLNQTLVCDFRVEDVDLGGQGAPLVPIGDQLLFPQYDYCLNLGGFANISTEIDQLRIAYDICPTNIVLNHYVANLNLDYDKDGDIARSGVVHEELLQQLNNLSFYRAPYPKSLGLEWVKAEVFPIIDSFQISVKDILRTYVEHIAIQIGKVVQGTEDTSMLVTGGGAFNTFLMSRFEDHMKLNIVLPETSVIDYKEALIFAFLGVLKLRNENNCLSSVTGAKNDHSSGRIYYP